jgi:hypothetical protein
LILLIWWNINENCAALKNSIAQKYGQIQAQLKRMNSTFQIEILSGEVVEPLTLTFANTALPKS